MTIFITPQIPLLKFWPIFVMIKRKWDPYPFISYYSVEWRQSDKALFEKKEEMMLVDNQAFSPPLAKKTRNNSSLYNQKQG